MEFSDSRRPSRASEDVEVAGVPTITGGIHGPLDREALFKLAYDELRALASAYLRTERQGHTLQTTALVHEALLRLFHRDGHAWPNVAAFCAAAATAMRRVLVDHARSRNRKKRGGSDMQRVVLDTTHLISANDSLDLVMLDRVLAEFEQLEPRAARVVELRFFCGLTEEETAEALTLSRRTVSKDWRFARAWLRDRLERNGVGE